MKPSAMVIGGSLGGLFAANLLAELGWEVDIEARARPHPGWTAEQLDQRPERVLHEVAASLSQIPELAVEI